MKRKSKNKQVQIRVATSKVNAHKLGLTVGLLTGLMHAIWSGAVFIGLAQNFLDWIFPMHFLNSVYSVAGFDLITALFLIIMASIGGYLVGLVSGKIWNAVN